MSGDQNKTEQPTPFKLRDAKKKGQVNKSQEFSVYLGILLALTLVYFSWQSVAEQLQQFAKKYILLSGQVSSSPEIFTRLMSDMAWHAIGLLLPLLLVVAGFGIFVNVIQTGFILSGHPIKPDFTK